MVIISVIKKCYVPNKPQTQWLKSTSWAWDFEGCLSSSSGLGQGPLLRAGFTSAPATSAGVSAELGWPHMSAFISWDAGAPRPWGSHLPQSKLILFIWGMLRTECLCPPQIYVEVLTHTQCDGMRRWGFQEVIKFRWDRSLQGAFLKDSTKIDLQIKRRSYD